MVPENKFQVSDSRFQRKTVRLQVAAFVFVILASQLLMAQIGNLNDRISELSVLGHDISDYKLGPGDLIEINVLGVEDFDYQMRISATGIINLPYLGKVQAAGLSAAELEEKLKLHLEGRFIKNPQVFVIIHEYKAHPVFILGAVNQPGQYQMMRPLTLIDVIAMAGGLDLLSADYYALIQRRKSNIGTKPVAKQALEQELEIIRVDLNDLLEQGSPEKNIYLQPGDVIQIPQRKTRRFFILGEVNGPGVFALPENRELLVTQALASAGGTARTAKMNKGTLVRYEENGERTQLAVNFKDILDGKKPDFAIQENDIIFIPGSRFKTIGYGMLGLLPGITSAVVVNTAIR